MGILTDALAIALGGLFGNRLQKFGKRNNYRNLGIGIMIVSLVGFLENMYNVEGEKVVSGNLIIVLFSFLLGSKIGDIIHLEEKLSSLSRTENKNFNAFLDATLFFGVGGLQISGPILLALNNDNSQLFIKTFVDAPFAIAFGATYGKIATLSSLPVALIQILIVLTAHFLSASFSDALISQLCAMGYIILFFSGFNLMSNGKHKINNINMLPGIFLVIFFNILTELI